MKSIGRRGWTAKLSLHADELRLLSFNINTVKPSEGSLGGGYWGLSLLRWIGSNSGYKEGFCEDIAKISSRLPLSQYDSGFCVATAPLGHRGSDANKGSEVTELEFAMIR